MSISERYKDQINVILTQIKNRLKDDQYFANVFIYPDDYKKAVDFNGTLKDIPRYTYTSISVPVKDLSQIDKVTNIFVEDWKKRTNNPAAIKSFKSFISMGSDIGWD